MAGAARGARAGYDRVIDLLEALVPLACRLERALRLYALVVALAAVLIVGAVVAVDVPGTVWTWGAVLVLLALLLFAPVVIVLFTSMLHEVRELPAQLRAVPDVAPARARELAVLVREANVHRHERARSIPRDTWRAGRLLNALRREIPSVSVLLSVARVPFLVLVGVALLVGALQVLLVPFVVVGAALSRAI